MKKRYFRILKTVSNPWSVKNVLEERKIKIKHNKFIGTIKLNYLKTKYKNLKKLTLWIIDKCYFKKTLDCR